MDRARKRRKTEDMNRQRTAEELLVQSLKLNYSEPSYLRPPTKNNEPLDLLIGLYPNVVDVDEKSAQVTLGACVFLTWQDSLLTWDPENHDGIKKLRLPVTDVWTPDVRAARTFQSDTTEAQLMVSHTGNIIYLPYTVYKFQGTIVSPSVYRVAAELGSWTYDVTKVNLKVVEKDGAGLDEFMEGPVWSLSNQGVTMTSKDYGTPDSPQVFVGAKYLMDVTKKSS